MSVLEGDLTPGGADTPPEPAIAPDGAETGTEGQARDYEAEAKAMGWQPADEFKGDPKRHVDARTFIERGETLLPLIKKDRDELKRELAELKRTMKQFGEFASKSEERAYRRATADLEARHAEAVETGDVKAAAAAVKELRELEKPEPPKPDQSGDPGREFAAWVEENDWYVTDDKKRAYADIVAQGMGPAGEYEGGGRKWLADLAAKVERKFADKKLSPVNGGGNRSGGTPGGRSFSDLPAAAKAQCERFVKSIPGFTKEQYVKDFQWD